MRDHGVTASLAFRALGALLHEARVAYGFPQNWCLAFAGMTATNRQILELIAGGEHALRQR